MTSRRTPPSATNASNIDSQLPPSERELIIMTDPAARLRVTPEGLASAAAADVTRLSDVLSRYGAGIRPLFDSGGTRAAHAAAIADVTAPPGAPPPPDLAPYFRVDAPDDKLDAVAADLRATGMVTAAYVKPPAYPATAVGAPRSGGAGTMEPVVEPLIELNVMTPRGEEAPPVTQDFTARQTYLAAAPAGIEAFFAHTQPGGRGAGVRIIDIEGAWRFTHEDLTQSQGGLVAGAASTDLGWRNHGTAVIGEFGGDVNGLGVTGICPDANVRAISIFGGMGSAPAIRRAADLLGPGDIVLIELHRPGPRASGAGQQGFIALEWWPDDFDAIRYATSRGVIVVEAAGNGAENLDDPAYDVPATGFPAGWSNPFRRGARDSGAILVGAGAPPPGTHGRDHGPDRSRLGFSNFGACVDVQGWGREVTTTGYGDLQGGPDEDFWYTDQFSGTSSASPIVVGALGCIQGNRRARSLNTLTPLAARTLLRTTGSPQQDAPSRPASQRIGNRPNLRQVIGAQVGLTVPLFRYWNPTNTDHFYTTDWSELGAGRHGWGYEGIQCYVAQQQVAGTVPLYRYWNPQIGDHFYTTSWSELGGGRYGWGFEGIQCYVYSQPALNRVPLFRYWNGTTGDHFYTANWGELGYGRYGYRLEGIQCFVAMQALPPEAEDEQPTASRFAIDQPADPAIPNLAMQAANGHSFPSGEMPASFSAGTGMSTTPEVPATFASPMVGQEAVGPAGSFSAGPPETFTVARSRKAGGASITIRLDGGDVE